MTGFVTQYSMIAPPRLAHCAQALRGISRNPCAFPHVYGSFSAQIVVGTPVANQKSTQNHYGARGVSLHNKNQNNY